VFGESVSVPVSVSASWNAIISTHDTAARQVEIVIRNGAALSVNASVITSTRCTIKLEFHGTDTDTDTDTNAPIV